MVRADSGFPDAYVTAAVENTRNIEYHRKRVVIDVGQPLRTANAVTRIIEVAEKLKKARKKRIASTKLIGKTYE